MGGLTIREAVRQDGGDPVGLREAALPCMEDLDEVTRENVRLAVRDDDEAVVVERFAAREVPERVRAAPPKRYIPHTLTDPRRLRGVLVAALSIVVRGNAAAAVRTPTPGVRAVARGISCTLARGGTEAFARRNAASPAGSSPTCRRPTPPTSAGRRRVPPEAAERHPGRSDRSNGEPVAGTTGTAP